MAVELNLERVGVEVKYAKDAVKGDTINVKATNPVDGKVSTRTGLLNDGKFTWTFPNGYVGSADFVVTGSDGGEDTGTVEVDFS